MIRTFRMMNVPYLRGGCGVRVFHGVAGVRAAAGSGDHVARAGSDPDGRSLRRRPGAPAESRKGSQLVELTLEQAQLIALEKNLDLKVGADEPAEHRLPDCSRRARAFNPRLQPGTTATATRTSPSNNTTEGVLQPSRTGTRTSTAGSSRHLPWHGGLLVGVNFTNSRGGDERRSTSRQPGVQLAAESHVHAAAAGRLQDGQHAQPAADVAGPAADRRHQAAGDDREHEGQRAAVPTGTCARRSSRSRSRGARSSSRSGSSRTPDSRSRSARWRRSTPCSFESQVANAEQTLLAAQIALADGGTQSEAAARQRARRTTCTGRRINPVDLPVLSVQSVDIQAAVRRALAERHGHRVAAPEPRGQPS